jgi:uncharacterized protein YajQ (UPF0234 family)
MPSFDVVSEIDNHELVNAVDQASRELSQRFDFKGTDAKFELEETTVTMTAPVDFQLKQMLDILKLKIAKRGIEVSCLEIKENRAGRQGFKTQGAGADSGRQGARHRQETRRFAGCDGAAAPG